MAIPVDEKDRSVLVDLLGAAGSGAVRLSLLFGSAIVALTIILAPMVESEASRIAANQSVIDQIATGSTQRAGRQTQVSRSYTIRRSVLQTDRNDVCIISADGMRTGTC